MLSIFLMKNSICPKLILSFILLFFALVSSQIALAAQIRLAWDPNTESNIEGYKIYYGTSSKSYIGSVDIGNVTKYTLTGLTQGQTYYIAVTAYNNSNSESGYSIEVSGVATETTLPVSETPPTITTSPTSEPTTTPEPAPASPPSVATQEKKSGGG